MGVDYCRSLTFTCNAHNFLPCFLYDINVFIFVDLVYRGENKKKYHDNNNKHIAESGPIIC